MDNIFTVFNTVIAGATAISIIFLKYYLTNKRSCDPITAQNTVDENIMAAIEYIQKELDADRVIIQEFHNGGKYFSGSSQHKLSITYEFCRKGISSVFRRFQNVRVSALSNILKHAITDQVHVNLDEEKCAYSYDLQTHGTTTAVFTVLKTLTNKNIGLLSIHYVNRTNTTLTPEQKELINRQRLIISGYLVYHKIKI